MQDEKIIYIDFDGTIQESYYPEIGFLNEGAYEFLWSLKGKGYQLILNSYRANINDESLHEALVFIKKYNLPIYDYNSEKIYPNEWNDYILENKFIDDECKGIPLRKSKRILNREVVDFKKLNLMLQEKN